MVAPARLPRPVISRLLFAMLVAVSVLAVVVPVASADESYDASPAACNFRDRGDGQYDANGRLYAACRTKILRWDADGTRMADIPVPAGLSAADVAPSQGAGYLYILSNEQLIRLDRVQGSTGYVVDQTWQPEQFPYGATMRTVNARNIAIDHWGDVYVSNYGTEPSGRLAPNRILKYNAKGKLLLNFGEVGDGDYDFALNRGLAVSRDGRVLLVTDHSRGRVKRFDWQPNGSYRFVGTIGFLDGTCTQPGGLTAPSDVGIDPWGFVYVTDTTCGRVHKYGLDGTFVATVAAQPYKKLHGLAVGRSGEFFAGEWNTLYRRAASNPVPGPLPEITRPIADTTAPVLSSLQMPATTTTQAITVRLTATDNKGVAEMRFANEDGNWGPWRPYAATSTHLLSPGYSIKGVYVQVRDAAGNESGYRFDRLLYTRP